LPNEPSWLSVDDVIALNKLAVAATDEPFGIVHPGSLESAVMRPRNRWAYGEADIVALAADFCAAIARNHPFLQGNKRTAFAAMDGFLAQNGWALKWEDEDETGEALVRLLTRDISEEAFFAIVAANVRIARSDERSW